jgi:hypothetical protein
MARTEYDWYVHEELNIVNALCEEFMGEGYVVKHLNNVITVYSTPHIDFLLDGDIIKLRRHDSICRTANVYDADGFGVLIEAAKFCIQKDRDCQQCAARK